MITEDNVLTAIYKVLQADSTLQGANYLNGASNIEKGPRRAERKAETATRGLIIKGGGNGIADEGAPLQDGIIYISAFVENNDDGTAKNKTLSLISGRVETLLQNTTLTISGARMFNCYLTAPHQTFYDPQTPDEHYSTSAFRVQGISL
jgi:hypothetical protein